MKIIKGSWAKAHKEVMTAQHEPFVFIAGNGSKWAGQEEDDIPDLLKVLGRAELDVDRFGNFITVNPCQGVKNTDYGLWSGEPQWIDGTRIFDVEPVVQFAGNFVDVSHGFSIYTNDPGTISVLTDAIEANLAKEWG